MGRTKSMDMAVPVPRRRRSVSSSDLELFQHSQHTCSTMGDWSSSRLLCHDEVHCYESGSNSFRPRSASLDEPAHVPTRRTSIRANASSVDLYQAYNDMSEQCNVPRSSVHSTSLQNTHSSSMPILPRRILSSTDLASDAYDEQPHASGMFLDDYEHLNETMDDTRVTKSSIDDKVQAVKVVNRDAAAASSYTAKRKSMGSKVSTKTEAIESSEDSTSGWSDNWSPSPTRNVSGRFVDLHKAASVPCLTCPQKPHHHGMIPSAVRRLVRRTRSASPTSQVHPGFGRLMQVVANVVRKEHHQHRKSYSKDNEFLSSTEFLEPSSLYMDQPQHGPTRLVVVQDGSAVTHVADMKKRRSSSSSGSQPSMFRTKLFGRS
ncbi:hypothetical protein MPSEU_000414100 [Mayamaea pseudoterrestris]|nr:hypothetical protein MPSEU_000414100 [Mayamaea pseudoterrestris]